MILKHLTTRPFILNVRPCYVCLLCSTFIWSYYV